MCPLNPIIHQITHLRISIPKLPPLLSPAQILHARSSCIVQEILELPGARRRGVEAGRFETPELSEPFVISVDFVS